MRELGGIREVERNGKLDGFVAVIVIVAVFGTPHSVTLIAGFAGLHGVEARRIESTFF